MGQQLRNQRGQNQYITKFKQSIRLRSLHYPIQYLCRSWPFRSLNLKLKRPVLIPRFQSQYMIQLLLARINLKYKPDQIQGLSFVDFGCGTGALGLSLAKQLGIRGVMIDNNQDCIKLTKLNAKINQVEVNKIQIIHSFMQKQLNYLLSQDIVISNPPYLSSKDYQTRLKPQIKRYEDKSALVADNDGMKYVEMLANLWKKQRVKNGILILQFDGRPLQQELSWLEQFVVNDQYCCRRFILLQH